MTARYAPTGTDELAAAAAEALGDRGAVLLARHGVVAVGASRPAAALATAVGGASGRRSMAVAAARPDVIDADALLRLRSPAARHRHRRRRRRRRRAGHGGGVAAPTAPSPSSAASPGSGGRSTRSPARAREAEIEGARRLAPGVLAATAATRACATSGVHFAESRMAALLGRGHAARRRERSAQPRSPTASRPRRAELGADLIVFLDVGGDALAHGDEPGLASPLCDALMLAAAARLAATTPAHAGARRHLRRRLRRRADRRPRCSSGSRRSPRRAASRARAGSRRRRRPAGGGRRGRAHRGQRAGAPLLPRRDRHRHDPPRPPQRRALARRRAHVLLRRRRRRSARPPASRPRSMDARDLEHANELLHGLGVRTELDYERDALSHSSASLELILRGVIERLPDGAPVVVRPIRAERQGAARRRAPAPLRRERAAAFPHPQAQLQPARSSATSPRSTAGIMWRSSPRTPRPRAPSLIAVGRFVQAQRRPGCRRGGDHGGRRVAGPRPRLARWECISPTRPETAASAASRPRWRASNRPAHRLMARLTEHLEQQHVGGGVDELVPRPRCA